MRMRTLSHLILACLLLSVVVVPSAFAHDNGHGRGRERQRSEDSDRGKHRGEGRGRGQVSFFGAPGQGECSKETMTCDYMFSRSNTAELLDRLNWLLAEHLDGVERVAQRLCSRAEQESECEVNFMAGLRNGTDAMELAVAESSCASLHLAWTKKEGLSQGWATTDSDRCTD